jgi:perosamine synthetase
VIENLICKDNQTLLEAMQLINENALGICFVVDKSNSLLGVVSDGDIRRAILSHKSLNSPIEEILSDNFVFGHIDESKDLLIKKITTKYGDNQQVKISILPLVNDSNHLVDYFQYSQQIHFPAAMPSFSGNELKYLSDAFLSSWISSTGPYIDRFETSFSKYSDCKFGVSTSNGTCALHLALEVLEIGDGDEVIVPDLTFAATINAVLQANATPVIVDVDEDSWCIDPTCIEKAITAKTKAIVPVHLFGQVCDMDGILQIAKKNNLKIIEDCAEAHGAKFKGKKVGSFGDIGCFSFYGNKVITTGEGGMCTTNNPKLNEKMRVMRDHGMSKDRRYWHEIVGFNYRLTNLQAAIGVAQLERIENIHKNRFSYEASYKEVMSSSKFSFQKDLVNRDRIIWFVSLLVKDGIDRDQCVERLKELGIEARPFFYTLSEMEIYKKYCNKDTPIAMKLSRIGFHLPTYEVSKKMTQLKEVLFNF